jgi:hypothetical protein
MSLLRPNSFLGNQKMAATGQVATIQRAAPDLRRKSEMPMARDAGIVGAAPNSRRKVEILRDAGINNRCRNFRAVT